MKFVYVITSSPADIYLEQTFLSMYTLLQHNPGARIALLTDDRTADTLTGARARVLEMVAEKVVVDFDPAVTNMRRSRHLKTSMRNLVDGDFLYIDGDTVVTAPIDASEFDGMVIGAVEDAHRPLEHHYGREKLMRQARQLGFDIEGEQYYFNGGVMFARDCDRARDFFRRWHENWLRSSALGINLDMPALVLTDQQSGHLISRLPGTLNCQLMYGFNHFGGAKIIHYFASRYSRANGGWLHPLMSPDTFGSLTDTFTVTDGLHRLAMDPLAHFAPGIELIGDTDVYLVNTHVYKLIRKIHEKAPRLFGMLQALLYKINNIKKKQSE